MALGKGDSRTGSECILYSPNQRLDILMSKLSEL